MIIKDVVKKRMEEKGIKVSKLAKKTGYTSRHIYDLLSGHTRWNEKHFSKIFDVLGLELDIKPIDNRPAGTDG
jgi:DNA-binding phage protein